MRVDVEDLALAGVKLLHPVVHGDERGWFQESYRSDWAELLGHEQPFVQDNHALSTVKGVLRGLHFQFPNPQAKLIRVVEGSILDVVVDIRHGSTTFGQHLAVELSTDNHRQIFVPHGFAHGYVTLSERVQVVYKVDAYYDPKADLGLAWNDPALEIGLGARG